MSFWKDLTFADPVDCRVAIAAALAVDPASIFQNVARVTKTWDLSALQIIELYKIFSTSG